MNFKEYLTEKRLTNNELLSLLKDIEPGANLVSANGTVMKNMFLLSSSDLFATYIETDNKKIVIHSVSAIGSKSESVTLFKDEIKILKTHL